MPNPRKEINTIKALELVEQGLTYDEIALQMGVDRKTVITRLDELPDSAHARARTASAESWLDRGFEKLESALDKEGTTDAAAARAYEQACARRAALRNPQYRDKQSHEHTGKDGAAIQIERIERVIV